MFLLMFKNKYNCAKSGHLTPNIWLWDLPLYWLVIRWNVMEEAKCLTHFLTFFKMLNVFPCIRLWLIAHILSPMQILPILAAGLPESIPLISTNPSFWSNLNINPYVSFLFLVTVTSRTIPWILEHLIIRWQTVWLNKMFVLQYCSVKLEITLWLGH